MNSLIDIFFGYIDRAVSNVVRLHLAELSLKYDFINWIFFIVLGIPLIYAECKNFGTKFSFATLTIIFIIFAYLCIFNLGTTISIFLCLSSIVLTIFIIYKIFKKKQILNSNFEPEKQKKPKKQKKQKPKFDKSKNSLNFTNVKLKNKKGDGSNETK